MRIYWIRECFARERRRRFFFCLRFFSMRRAAAECLPYICRSICSIKRRNAKNRLSACERLSRHLIHIPVGLCFKITHVATLLTFWPPRPPDRTNCSSISLQSMLKSFMRACKDCHFAGVIIDIPFSARRAPLLSEGKILRLPLKAPRVFF